jgi:hypothetical protein
MVEEIVHIFDAQRKPTTDFQTLDDFQNIFLTVIPSDTLSYNGHAIETGILDVAMEAESVAVNPADVTRTPHSENFAADGRGEEKTRSRFPVLRALKPSVEQGSPSVVNLVHARHSSSELKPIHRFRYISANPTPRTTGNVIALERVGSDSAKHVQQ